MRLLRGKAGHPKISLTEPAQAVTLRNIFPSDDRERKETDASESRWAVKNGSIPLLLNHSGAFFSEQSKKRRIPPLQEPSHKCRVAPRHYAPAGYRRQGFSYGSGRSPLMMTIQVQYRVVPRTRPCQSYGWQGRFHFLYGPCVLIHFPGTSGTAKAKETL